MTDSSATDHPVSDTSSTAGERPNFATLLTDEANGLQYITDVKTRKRLYKLPECGICGMRPWSFSGNTNGWDCCNQHQSERRERNDNVDQIGA